MPFTFQKVRFTGRAGATTGLVFTSAQLERMSVIDLSRFWPESESSRMSRVELSPVMPTWDAAFQHQFPEAAAS